MFRTPAVLMRLTIYNQAGSLMPELWSRPYFAYQSFLRLHVSGSR